MNKKTLIFESNEGMSRTLVTALAALGDTEVLDVARTHSQALQLLEKHKHKWDVVVIDLASMAHMALVVVLRACENRLAHQLVMVLAKDSSAPVRSVCATLGADFVFGKNEEMDEFLSACRCMVPAPGRAAGSSQQPSGQGQGSRQAWN